MQFNLLSKDPFSVLTSTKTIVEDLQCLAINEQKLTQLSQKINQQLEQGLNTYEIGLGLIKNYQKEAQLIFLEDVVNFCFWSEKGKPLWRVKSAKGIIPSGGYFSLVNCFKRALINKVPILNTNYLTSLTLADVKTLFKGLNDVDIPLADKRLANLHEAAKVLKQEYSGQFINLLNKTNYDAVKLVEIVYQDFPSFRDVACLNGNKIYFLKRAQILAQDLSYLTKRYKSQNIKNLETLTAFADYKLPQMLRKFEVLIYKSNLARKIDNYCLITAGDREEIEIRSSTIWCIELIRQKLKKYSAADIDNALWLISQDQTNVLPYHRTYTIFY